MTDFGSGQFGRWLVLAGVIIAAAGLAMIVFGKIGFFRLPGDLQLCGRGWRIFLPITSCILISIILTIILLLVRFFRR